MFLLLSKKRLKLRLIVILIIVLILMLFYWYWYTPYLQSSYIQAALSPVLFGMQTTIVIDPGHGGRDPGVIHGEIYEKDINLNVAKKLKEHLNANGYRVILTRDNDTNLVVNKNGDTFQRASLKNRIEIAKIANAKLLISIHCNGSTIKNRSGSLVFYQKDDDLSKKMAFSIFNKLNELNHSKRGPEEGDYFLLNNSPCPTVLIELGFLSCEKDRKLLTSPVSNEKQAQFITEGILECID